VHAQQLPAPGWLTFLGADLEHASLEGASLRKASCAGIRLLDCSLASADLTGADLTRSTLIGVDLQDAEVSDAVFLLARGDRVRTERLRGSPREGSTIALVPSDSV
jgi:uncharacterized protein YjbI with pentapeptide repeats